MTSHIHTRGIIAAGQQFSKQITVTAGQELNLSEPIPASAVNLAVAYAAIIAKLQSIFIIASAALVIKTNSSGSPANTITLTPDVPYLWQIGDGTLRDTAGVTIATNITSLFVTNPAASIVDLTLFSLVDPT